MMSVPDLAGQKELTAQRLEDAVARAAGARNVAEAQIVGAVAEALETDAWQGWGITSAEHWVAWQLGATRSRAKIYTSIARRRQELPETWRRFTEGALSVDQVGIIVRYCPPQFDRSVAQFAVTATIAQLTHSLRRYHWGHRPEVRPSEETPRSLVRSASLVLHDDGVFDFRVSGPVTDGARLGCVLEQFRSMLRTEGGGNPPDKVTEVTGYDAFMALIDAAGESDRSASRRNRTRLLLHLELDHAGELAGRLHLGPVLSDDDLRHLSCEADAQVLFEREGRALHLGRSRRVVPDWLRSIIVDRDCCCRFPGCGQAVSLDVHHLVHWVDGGTTEPANLVTLCARHHTLHHQGQFSMVGNPELVEAPHHADGLTFRNPYGLPIRSRPPEPPDRGAEGPPGPVYQRPLGERLRQRDVYFHPEPQLC